MENNPSLLIVAGEASSAQYATQVLKKIKDLNLPWKSFGAGSQDMEDLGFERIGKSEEMAVVGIVEVIEHYSDLKKIFNEIIAEAAKRKPKVALLLDYPDFNFMLAEKLKELGIPCVYYISPQVWAWRKGRVQKIKKFFDEVLCLFPFEVDFYKKYNVNASFVGHPLLETIDDNYFDPQYRKLHRSKCGIQESEFVVGLMPGSRISELKYHIKTQIEVAHRLNKKYKHLKFYIPVAPTLTKDFVADQFADLNLPVVIQKLDPFKMIIMCDAILASSGTATLMIGLMQVPMVIMYKVNWLTAMIGRRIVKLKYFGISNFLLDAEVCPERFQEKATPEELTRLMSEMIENKDYREKMSLELKRLHLLLGEKGATQKVIESLKRYF